MNVGKCAYCGAQLTADGEYIEIKVMKWTGTRGQRLRRVRICEPHFLEIRVFSALKDSERVVYP